MDCCYFDLTLLDKRLKKILCWKVLPWQSGVTVQLKVEMMCLSPFFACIWKPMSYDYQVINYRSRNEGVVFPSHSVHIQLYEITTYTTVQYAATFNPTKRTCYGAFTSGPFSRHPTTISRLRAWDRVTGSVNDRLRPRPIMSHHSSRTAGTTVGGSSGGVW